MAKLPLSFYMRDTTTVARELLGQKLVRVYKGQRIAGRITEVEAYLGADDKACHSYGHRRTPRTEVMYAAGGLSYIYLIYGLYHCFNVVTQKRDVPEAVLIRSLEPSEGLSLMKRFRAQNELRNLTTGPGKLGEALHLTKDLNGLSLKGDVLFLERGARVPSSEIVSRPRVGVDYAEDHAEWPLRFYIRGSEFISRK